MESVRAVEMCSEQAMIVVGPTLLDKLKRLQRPNAHFLHYMQACCTECQRINPSGWGASIPGEVIDPPMSQKPHSSGYGRSELHILADNVVRDLPSFDKHVHLLKSYIEKHPEEATNLEEYLQTLPLSGLVRDLLDRCRAGKLKEIGSITEQQAVSAAQNLFTLRSRFESMRPGGRGQMSHSATVDSSSIGTTVLQSKDINAESFSVESVIPVPQNLNETKAKLIADAQKKRRTMDPAIHTALQSRLARLMPE
ncbi:hypothetical protein KIN20_030745 [Parelaphostrongylus tenuis]|uniref:Uncharacterized protein n=1 Tax=Parelaphostrongylus tenuis TaxID=148309 RepID=A0AAD5WGC4_PARTN|nr:hypothetical protein KIN20_030745 [Parelaphostrongylus tenuis]